MSIVFKNVSKSFGDSKVLDKFNLIVKDESKVCIMGESGSGKTTVLNIMAGIIKIDSGNVSGIDGKKIAMVFQDDRLAEELTVYRNIKIVLPQSVGKDEISKALTEVGLSSDILNEKVSTLSGGMKRRVAILRAILCYSDIVLLDEPTKGLDEGNKQTVIDYILRKTEGKTLVWVTHDREEAKYVSDTIIEI